MGKETQKKKLGPNTYVVTQFGARIGRGVLFRLTTMIGPAAGGLLKGGLSEAGLAGALTAWSTTAKPEEFDWLCDQFASCSKVETPLSTGAAITLDLADQSVFDDHFVGRYDEMIGWLAFAVSVNFSSFLFGKGGVLSALAEQFGAETKAPSN